MPALIIAVLFEKRLERIATPSITLSLLLSIQLEMSAEADVRKMHYSQLSLYSSTSLYILTHIRMQYANLNDWKSYYHLI